MKKWMSVLYGFIIGATMMIPGVSGGSMAMILGIYDKIITAVSSFRKSPGGNFLFLFLLGVSGAAGMFLFSTPLSWLLEQYPMPARYFFLGAIFGGIPMILKKAGGNPLSGSSLIFILSGVLGVLLLALIPGDLVVLQGGNGQKDYAMLVLLGVPTASALVLPGISVSHFLLVLGLYDGLLQAVRKLDISFLLPLGLGMILGVILVTKLLGFVIEHYPRASYLVILGFVLGSALEIIPGIPTIQEAVWCILTCFCGTSVIYFLSKKNL